MVRFLLIGFLALALAGEAEARGCEGRFPRLRATAARVVHPFARAAPCGECEGGGPAAATEAAYPTARVTPVRTAIAAVAGETAGRARAIRSARGGCPCGQRPDSRPAPRIATAGPGPFERLMNSRQSIFEKIEALKAEAVRALKRDCPVGRVVIYRHGNRIRTVEVITPVNERGTLQVRCSRKPYWISGARVLGTQLTFTEKL